MTSHETTDAAEATPEAPERKSLWFPIVMCLMVLGFGVIVVQRHQIRVWWYVGALESDPEPAEALRYYDLIASELAASERALLSATHHERSDVRMIAAGLARDLDEPQAIEALTSMLKDSDLDVRGTAALVLAFDKRDSAWKALSQAARSKDTDVAAAAVSVINRSTRKDAPCVLVEAMRSHSDAYVRAQAAEGLIMSLLGATPTSEASMSATRDYDLSSFDDCGVYAAIAVASKDDGAFDGRLAFERELEAVIGQAARQGIAVERGDEGAAVEETRTVAGLVRSLITTSFGVPEDVFSEGDEALAAALKRAVTMDAKDADD